MKNNILIIDSRSSLNPLKDFFEELNNRDLELHFLVNKKNNINLNIKFHRHKLYLPLNFRKPCRSWMAFLLFPLYLSMTFFYLLYFKYKKKTKTIVCVGCFEKLIFTPSAKLLRLNTIWLEMPGEKNFELKRLLKTFYIFLTRFARLVTFSRFHEQILLGHGVRSSSTKVISAGIRLNNFQNQENIFNQIAENDHRNFTKKFFTIGTVVDLNDTQRIEILFQAIKKCLTVIHHLQVIIIGDGSERKNLAWLAKKMDIDNMVWFVGEQKNIRRWFENFDIYIITSKEFDLEDTNSCLKAMSAELPVIGPDNIGLDEIINNNQNGMVVEAGNSESLAQAIIKLQQDQRKRKLYGQNALATVESKNNLVTMVDKFAKIADLA